MNKPVSGIPELCQAPAPPINSQETVLLFFGKSRGYKIIVNYIKHCYNFCIWSYRYIVFCNNSVITLAYSQKIWCYSTDQLIFNTKSIPFLWLLTRSTNRMKITRVTISRAGRMLTPLQFIEYLPPRIDVSCIKAHHLVFRRHLDLPVLDDWVGDSLLFIFVWFLLISWTANSLSCNPK